METDNIILKNGNVATDPRLGRIPQFDKRSLKFNVREIIQPEHTAPRSYSWRCLQWLDQADTSACVGFSWANEMIARPKEVIGVDNISALELYHTAQTLDEWSGEDYEGTSVLAGAKAVQQLGHMSEYRWAFDTNDLAIAVSWYGPAVLGINWYQKMFTPDIDGVPYGWRRLRRRSCDPLQGFQCS